MYSPEAAKNLLNEISCFQCRGYFDKNYHCFAAINNQLPETLHCKDFKRFNELLTISKEDFI